MVCIRGTNHSCGLVAMDELCVQQGIVEVVKDRIHLVLEHDLYIPSIVWDGAAHQHNVLLAKDPLLVIRWQAPAGAVRPGQHLDWPYDRTLVRSVEMLAGFLRKGRRASCEQMQAFCLLDESLHAVAPLAEGLLVADEHVGHFLLLHVAAVTLHEASLHGTVVTRAAAIQDADHVGQAELLQHLVTLVRCLATTSDERLDVSLAVLGSERRKPHSWMRGGFPCSLCVIDHEDRAFHFRQDGGCQSIAELRNGHCPRTRIHHQGDELLKLGLQELEPLVQAFPIHVASRLALLKYVCRHQVCQRQLSPRNRQGCTDGGLLLVVGCVARLPHLVLILGQQLLDGVVHHAVLLEELQDIGCSLQCRLHPPINGVAVDDGLEQGEKEPTALTERSRPSHILGLGAPNLMALQLCEALPVLFWHLHRGQHNLHEVRQHVFLEDHEVQQALLLRRRQCSLGEIIRRALLGRKHVLHGVENPQRLLGGLAFLCNQLQVGHFCKRALLPVGRVHVQHLLAQACVAEDLLVNQHGSLHKVQGDVLPRLGLHYPHVLFPFAVQLLGSNGLPLLSLASKLPCALQELGTKRHQLIDALCR